jgi:hypothetical protein
LSKETSAFSSTPRTAFGEDLSARNFRAWSFRAFWSSLKSKFMGQFLRDFGGHHTDRQAGEKSNAA